MTGKSQSQNLIPPTPLRVYRILNNDLRNTRQVPKGGQRTQFQRWHRKGYGCGLPPLTRGVGGIALIPGDL
jgi:hypothetical protein